MLIRRLLGISVLALALAGCHLGGGGDTGNGTDGGKGGDPIPIGYYGAKTGQTSTYGLSTEEGIDLAVDSLNQKPPLGRPLDIHPEDDQGKADQANTLVQRLL